MKKAISCALSLLVALMATGCKDGRPANEVNSLDDVADRTIGALYGTPSALIADELGVARIYFSGEELLYGLSTGAVDCAVMESVVAGELVSGSQDARILGEALLVYELRFAVPRENAELLEVVNSALSTLSSNGTLRNLRDKYFSGRNYTYIPPEDTGQRQRELVLAISPDSPPYAFKDENGEYTGLDVEVARAVCDHLNVDLRIIEEDISELATAVWFGRANLAVGWLPGDVDEQVSISDAYANITHVVLVRR